MQHWGARHARNRKSLPLLVAGALLLQLIGFPGVYALHSTPVVEDTGSSIISTFSFDEPTLTEVSLDNRTFTKIDMNECAPSAQPGNPALPVYSACFLLPPGKEVAGILVTTQEAITLPCDALTNPVLPQQDYVPLDDERGAPLFVMNKTIYESSAPVYNQAYEDGGIGYCRGFTIETMYLYPVQYIPNTGALSYFPEMTVTIELKAPEVAALSEGISFLRNSAFDREVIREMVANPSTLDSYSPSAIRSLGGSSDDPQPISDGYPGGLCTSGQQYQYVIITSASLKSTTGYPYNWSSLITHRQTYNGLAGTIVTVQDIDACADYWNTNSTFNDSQAHIREFCKDAYLDWGTEYIILGGTWRDEYPSQQVVPYRLFTDRFETLQYNTMPCDMYYSHLDGTWIDAAQSIWGGGMGSGVNDHYGELYLGRITVYNASMISNAVKKIIWYDLTASGSWLKTATFAGGDLGWFTADGKQYMEELRLGTDTYRTFTGFEEWNTAHPSYAINTASRLYAYDYGSENSYLTALDSSIQSDASAIINNIDHSDWNSPFGLTFWSYRVNTKPFFGYSQGCLAGRFSAGYAGCEQLMCRYADRNAFALVLNTGYGYGSGSSTNGPSQYQHCYFWDYFFNNQSTNQQNWQLGRAMTYAEDKMSATVDSYGSAWCYAWYSAHLFGDPAQTLRLSASTGSILVSGETPSNGSAGVPITTFSLGVLIQQTLGHPFNYTIHTNPNIGSSSATGASNGTKSCTVSGLNYATTYHWYVNVTDGSSWVNKTYTFTTQSATGNTLPMLSSPSPANGSTGKALSPKTNITATTGGDADLLTLTFFYNTSAAPTTWTNYGHNNSVINGTYRQTFTAANAYNKKYYWKVTVSDGTANISYYYGFTTKNTIPTLNSPSPANGSVGKALSPKTNITANTGGDGQSLTITWWYNTSGAPTTWTKYGQNNSAGNGTYRQTASFASAYNKKYYWKVCVNDGIVNISYFYGFTTLNTVPVLSSPSPANGSTGKALAPKTNITANTGGDGQSLTITWWHNTSGAPTTWTKYGQNNSAGNGN